MNFKNIKDELKNILQGKSTVSNGELIQTTANYLRESYKASGMAEECKPDRKEETKALVKFINENKLWNCNINFTAFVSQGAEQRVYIQN